MVRTSSFGAAVMVMIAIMGFTVLVAQILDGLAYEGHLPAGLSNYWLALIYLILVPLFIVIISIRAAWRFLEWVRQERKRKKPIRRPSTIR